MQKHHVRHKKDAHITNEDIYDDVEKIKAALVGATRDVRGKAGEMFADSVDSVKMKSSELQNNVAGYTAEKPFKSLGIAFAVGITIGYLLRR